MPVTVDKILGKPLLHTHQVADVVVSGNGSIDNTSTVTVTINTTLDLNTTILVQCSTANITVSLPQASTKTNSTYRIKKIDSTAYQVIVDPNGTETIDGETTISMAYKDSAMSIVSNGIGWYII